MPQKIDNLLVWGSDIEEGTLQQAGRTSRLPFLGGHVALMPDAHIGIGATVGSVIPTQGAIIPAAVGVDIGCGMAAVSLNLNADHLPDDLDAFMSSLEQAIPAGVGQGHRGRGKGTNEQWRTDVNIQKTIGWPATDNVQHNSQGKAISQMGTLGGGNHFFEICLDEKDDVWIVLHSGSRGIGNELAQRHMKIAKKMMKDLFITLEDPDLAYFTQNTPEFNAYIADMLWAQEYARMNRDTMLDAALKAFAAFMDWENYRDWELFRVNCHHNFTQMENHNGKNLWITRKGAIKADTMDWGVIPGSMGTRSYIVQGLGNPSAYKSCAHGAGRKMSRTKARAEFSTEDLEQAMAGKIWNADKASKLVDEIPSSYKDIDQVMEDQRDLIEVKHTLHQILNFKGT
jgi:RNA-splicing ligase RtcB